MYLRSLSVGFIFALSSLNLTTLLGNRMATQFQPLQCSLLRPLFPGSTWWHRCPVWLGVCVQFIFWQISCGRTLQKIRKIWQMEASGVQAICKKQVRNRIKIFLVNNIHSLTGDICFLYRRKVATNPSLVARNIHCFLAACVKTYILICS